MRLSAVGIRIDIVGEVEHLAYRQFPDRPGSGTCHTLITKAPPRPSTHILMDGIEQTLFQYPGLPASDHPLSWQVIVGLHKLDGVVAEDLFLLFWLWIAYRVRAPLAAMAASAHLLSSLPWRACR